MIINIKKAAREKFVEEMRSEINQLPTDDDYHKELGLLCSQLVESVNVSTFKSGGK